MSVMIEGGSADLDSLRAELQRTQKERHSALDALAVALHDGNQKDAEIARLREDYDKAVTKLGAEMVAKARVENKLDRMRKALEGAPCDSICASRKQKRILISAAAGLFRWEPAGEPCDCWKSRALNPEATK